MSADGPRDRSLVNLFRQDADVQVRTLTSALLALERDQGASVQLERSMRAAHSLKGAARIAGFDAIARVAHAMEGCFVSAQRGQLAIGQAQVDLLLQGVDLLTHMAAGAPADQADTESRVTAWLAALPEIADDAEEVTPAGAPSATAPARGAAVPPHAGASAVATETASREVRVAAERLDALVGLASEAVVQSRWVKPLAESLRSIGRLQDQAGSLLDRLRDALAPQPLEARDRDLLAELQRALLECDRLLSERVDLLETFDRRSVDLGRRLYDAALSSRMRLFADVVDGLPRIVRDLARSLGKQVRVEVVGETTRVDRDILARLEAPLAHLVRNAVDHGVETPDERRIAGKPAEGLIRVEARHHAGLLHVAVSDDGRGIDVETVRAAVIERRLIVPEAAALLSDRELLEFLLLPGFTTKSTVTDVSGRGVGLDAVRDVVGGVRGTVQISSRPRQGTTVQLRLPVTLSVIRALLVDIAGEPYAFPLAAITKVVRLPPEQVEWLEGRQHFSLDGERVGLVTAHQALELGEPPRADWLSVVVVGDGTRSYGMVVDRLLGEREIVVRPLDTQLAKVRHIAAGALMEDGSPVLILDTEDLLQTLGKLASADRLLAVRRAEQDARSSRKRVLVVDDSLTVRELERKLLAAQGYEVEVAVDGLDGWNAARAGRFDLVLTDVDMPRMDGIELVTAIKSDARLASLPVMVVSYKDRDEDRRRGLDAGAAYYLTKSSFHDDTLVQAVVNLIGEAEA